jgi:hypothetical protein
MMIAGQSKNVRQFVSQLLFRPSRTQLRKLRKVSVRVASSSAGSETGNLNSRSAEVSVTQRK